VIRSIRLRMTVLFFVIVAPLLVLSSQMVLVGMRKLHGDETDAIVGKAIKVGASQLRNPGWRKDLSELFGAEALRRRHIGALVADKRGTVLWRSDSDVPNWPDPPERSTKSIQVDDLTLCVNLQDFPRDGNPDATSLWIICTTAILVLTAGSWLLVGRTLSPIRSLSRQAAAASADDAETRLVPPSQDLEIRELVSTLNGFLDRTREASEERARFYAAASHELRTPLQGLSGHLEVTLAQPRDNVEYQATMQEALVQTQRLVSLVESILLLHQLQSPMPAVSELVSLSSEIEDQVQSIQPLVEVRGLRLTSFVEPGIHVTSIPRHVSVLIRNLMENAAKYAQESGEVKLSLAQSSGGAVFRIENQVSSGTIDAAHLYEAFYRLDASRSAKSGGNGLGLAICRAVARANRWALDVEMQSGTFVAMVTFHL
jgi:signal transduction histidine kinase